MTSSLQDPPDDGEVARVQQALEQAADELVLRREAQGRAERWLDGVLRHVAQPLLVVDGAGTVRAASWGASELLGGAPMGGRPRRVVGRSLASVMEEHLASEQRDEVLHHVRRAMPTRVVAEDGTGVSTTTVHDDATGVPDGDLVVLVDP